ncbi:MAG: transcription-repair coupling factor [Paludibacteraceae bacterium]|nr:transcription-repair coupling factor [Paludibacteraceae bacterium]
MQIKELYEQLSLHTSVSAIKSQLLSRREHLLLTALRASARAVVLKALEQPSLVVVMTNEDEAQYMFSDLKTIGTNAFFFSTSHRRLRHKKSADSRQAVDEAMAVQRTEVLSYLSSQPTEPYIIVTYPDALIEEVPPMEQLSNATIHIQKGEKVRQSDLVEKLIDGGFERVDFVYEPGQVAVRGGIVDVYSFSHDNPYRLDFFGDEVDSIREFDIETQLSEQRLEAIDIVGDSTLEQGGDLTSFAQYLPSFVVWASDDWSMVRFRLDSAIGGVSGNGWQFDGSTLEMRDTSSFDTYDAIAFHTEQQPLFHKNFDLLTDDLKRRLNAGYRVYILADQQKQCDRLQSVFEQLNADISFIPVDHTLHGGWIDHDARAVCYTDHEIFERYHRVTMQSDNARRGKAVVTLKEINQLRVGDYVVHSDHGIGQFDGLVTTSVNGRQQEMIKLTYKGGDTIFVSIHNLHRISKYKGREGTPPTISKLGSGAWERLKERTKDKVKDIARDLIQLYATRKRQPGFAYMPDGYMQHELEASFLYEDTPDQAKATLDVKRDMESAMPMDRLICGDVGFGKTEIAMRAAFKAATDGKQTAVLVPTTVLALQHYNTFRERFKNFPVKVQFLSRGKSPKETKEVLADLKEGKIDILIGTHKLISKQVVWHDLGLLIIDEEQKFGVAVKEKLKALRTNVDVLTLTATPIPRTLQFSLLGARDLSVMTTPPPNRYPVQTELLTPDDEDLIKEAIDLEMGRNGQVFVVNNRIEMLPRIERRLHALCPEARIITAHGQMPTDEMEERLEAFINYDYDILIATTIIESGIDIPNVNTMIIYSAQHYGLSDLHQLRGRVGRSNRKAYCYLVAPERELLTDDARRRLDALTTFAELGSGFHLAMQDLDIRGAGNLLGSEQSGFIADLGYETYQRILNEAVEEIRDEMGMPQGEEDNGNSSADITREWCHDTQMESDLPLSFPNTYIENISERITLYRELDSLKSEAELSAFQKRLIDRFGTMPDEAAELLNVVRLRWICCRLGIEKVYLKKEHLTLYFVTNNDKYWHSDAFGKIVSFVFSRASRCRMVEDKDKQGKPTGKRYAVVEQVKTVAGAIHLLTKIENSQVEH